MKIKGVGAVTNLLGHAIGLSGNGTSDVSTVSMSVNIFALEDGVPGGGPTLELGMVDLNSAINNVGVRLGAGRGIVGVGGGTRPAAGNSSKTPWSILLASQGPLALGLALGLALALALGGAAGPKVHGVVVIVTTLQVDLLVELNEGDLVFC